MCVSAAGAADFSGTRIYVGEARHPEDYSRLVHVLGYGNQVRNLHSGPNAMWIHLPAAGALSHENLIFDVPRWVMDDMVEAVRPRTRGAKGMTLSFGLAQVVEYGVYHVVLAESPHQVSEALSRVPERKRPEINPDMYDWYDQMYPGWGVALFCFDNAQSADADPVWLWYDPKRFLSEEFQFHIPAVDAHDGNVPNLSENVMVDHWLIIGSTVRGVRGHTVSYRGELSLQVEHFMPEKVVGKHFSGYERNGDWKGPVHPLLVQGMTGVLRRLAPTDLRMR